ncbi:hypothetical protein E1301_Tti022837 [Triplophysa tibetana]|uniref:Uncharacterized protein n=1 Tax=Triplophysa tibetana TaxID=1572043 RepID=A0A5A9P5Q9_9TELE|nr:hypothetical protein E1301_Tti022837 [Triplophysa tibetana]
MSTTMDLVEENFKQKIWGKQGLKQKKTHKCDAVFDFVPIVSRLGTDISAALDRLNSSGVHKPVVLVVLHHTFDNEKVVPDSKNAVNRENTLAVDCLFNEDVGLLNCPKNEKAYEAIAKYLKSNNLTSYAYYKDLPSPYPSSDDTNIETSSLIHSTEDSLYRKFLTQKYWVVVIALLVLVLIEFFLMLKIFDII